MVDHHYLKPVINEHEHGVLTKDVIAQNETISFKIIN